MSAPPGNRNAAKAKLWSEAIKRAVTRRANQSGRGFIEELDALAEEFLQAVQAGDIVAWKELGDRLEGKPAQQVQLTGADDGPVVLRLDSSEERL